MVNHSAPPRPASPLYGQTITVLLVDDEEAVLSRVREILEARCFVVVSAKSTSQAIHAILSSSIDVAMVDWRLAGKEDGIALGRSLKRDYGIPFIVFSGYLTTEVTGNAYKQGAIDVIDKPVRAERLFTALKLVSGNHRLRDDNNSIRQETVQLGSDSVSRRWATSVLRACRAVKDPTTESAVAAAAGLSTSVFRKLCRECSVSARHSRDLARFLRALSRAHEDGSTLRSHLAGFDPRTRAGLFERAAVSPESRFIPLRTFLLNQRFIASNSECLRELAHLAANDPLFFIERELGQTGDDKARQA